MAAQIDKSKQMLSHFTVKNSATFIDSNWQNSAADGTKLTIV